MSKQRKAMMVIGALGWGAWLSLFPRYVQIAGVLCFIAGYLARCLSEPSDT
jgi:hypothetical protein